MVPLLVASGAHGRGGRRARPGVVSADASPMGMSAEQSGAAPGPPLGELLLSRGLITAEQLEEALADQRDSGRPLGEIFVRLGFATGPMIGQALATQQGRMLKSEYGFATGFDATSPATGEDEREPRSEEHTSELQSPVHPLSLHDALPISPSSSRRPLPTSATAAGPSARSSSGSDSRPAR